MAGAEQPRLQLVGPPEAVTVSSSTALVLRRGGAVTSHDVNGYYAALGVAPGATRRELMVAYRDRGTDSAYLTYVFQRLLDPGFRSLYDAQPRGRALPDAYNRAAIWRQAHLRAGQETASTGRPVTAADILFSLGVHLEEVGGSFLDSLQAAGFDESGAGDRQSPLCSSPPSYGFLQYGSTCDDVHRVIQLREGLARALADHEGVPQFAVGYHGIPGNEFLVAKLDGTPVVFIHEDSEVTDELIAAAATAATQ